MVRAAPQTASVRRRFSSASRLSAIGYRLLAIGSWLSALGYRLLAIGYWLSAIGSVRPPVPRNVEIKARLSDPAATERAVAAAADGPPETMEQTDTFFRVPAGRLKLRETSGGRAELIFYVRPDSPDPAESRFSRAGVADAPALRALLAAALGTAGTVRKRRLVHHVGRTRVHLDRVEGLGDFLELEVQLAEGEPAAAGVREAEALAARFGIPRAALVAEAYVDLLPTPRYR